MLLLTISVPFAVSFSRKINFYSNGKKLFLSLLIPFVLFVLIDMISTYRNLWSFNPEYVTGIYIFNLPLEEVLFFAVIPFSCLFLWETVKYIEIKVRNKR